MDKQYGPKSKFEEISDTAITGHKRFSNNKEIKKFLNRISEISVLSPEEEKYWFTRYNNAEDKEEKSEIRNTIITHNLKLVSTLASRYNRKDLDFFDFVQEGVLGLVEAIDKFDITRGTKFSTFAVDWIQKYMVDNFYDNERSIDWTNHARRIIKAMENMEEDYLELNNGKMTITNEIISEIKEETKASDETIMNVLQQKNMLNIEEEIYSEDGEYIGRIMDIISSNEDQEQAIIDKESIQELKDYFDTYPISERNKDIIRRKFGVGYEKEQTFEEIGKHHNMSLQNAHRIYKEGIQRMRKSKNVKND